MIFTILFSFSINSFFSFSGSIIELGHYVLSDWTLLIFLYRFVALFAWTPRHFELIFIFVSIYMRFSTKKTKSNFVLYSWGFLSATKWSISLIDGIESKTVSLSYMCRFVTRFCWVV